ncbi:MAG: DNA polymerase III subunit delta [Hyphomicrobiales bacterium]
MAAFKAHQVAAAAEKPDPRFRGFLVYGPEAALTAERASQLAATLASTTTPAGEVLRIDDRDLADRPDRIAVEARSPSMFAGRSVLRVKAGARLNADMIEELLGETIDAVIVIEAGNLRPDARLRKLFEKHPAAAALPCYPESERDLARTLQKLARDRGLTVSPEAQSLLLARAAGDPGAARAEMEKLALYAGDTRRIDADDVEAVSGDWAQAALDTLAMATSAGNVRAALAELDRVVTSGQSAQSAIAALSRQFERLHRIAAAVESGASISSAVGGLRPPLHFRTRDAMERDAARWPRPRAAAALAAIAAEAAHARRHSEFERQIAERLIISLAGRDA